MKRISLRRKKNTTDEERNSGEVDPNAAQLNIETFVVENETHCKALAEQVLQEYRAIAQDTEGWASVDDRIAVKRLNGNTSRRGIKIVRGECVCNRSARQIHHYMKTERGMKAIDPKGELSSMGMAYFGPFQLEQSDGTCHIDYIKDVFQKSKDLLALVVYDEDNYIVTTTSTLYHGVAGGSPYQSIISSSKVKGRTRIAFASEYRCIKIDKNSCKFICTFFLDMCGKTPAVYNNYANKNFMKGILTRVENL